MLVVVDQPNTIGALPIAVARDVGADVAYLPGLAMRKAADLYPGQSKTDARDAFIFADTARTMPHTLRAVDRDSDVLSALKVLSGFDEDLASSRPGRSTGCGHCWSRSTPRWSVSSLASSLLARSCWRCSSAITGPQDSRLLGRPG